jgi:hypothetical protein
MNSQSLVTFEMHYGNMSLILYHHLCMHYRAISSVTYARNIPCYMYRRRWKRFPLVSLIYPYNRSTAPTLLPIYMCQEGMRHIGTRPVPYIPRYMYRSLRKRFPPLSWCVADMRCTTLVPLRLCTFPQGMHRNHPLETKSL